jgi:hypothetical protein
LVVNARKLLFLIIMSKQSTIDSFINRRVKITQPKASKAPTVKKVKHNSSRECSDEDTIRLPDDEPEVKLEVYE